MANPFQSALDGAEHDALVEVLLQERVQHQQRQVETMMMPNLIWSAACCWAAALTFVPVPCATSSNCCKTTCNGCFVSSVM